MTCSDCCSREGLSGYHKSTRSDEVFTVVCSSDTAPAADYILYYLPAVISATPSSFDQAVASPLPCRWTIPTMTSLKFASKLPSSHDRRRSPCSNTYITRHTRALYRFAGHPYAPTRYHLPAMPTLLCPLANLDTIAGLATHAACVLETWCEDQLSIISPPVVHATNCTPPVSFPPSAYPRYTPPPPRRRVVF